MIVYIGTNPDGFIARKNGDIDWIPLFGYLDKDLSFNLT